MTSHGRNERLFRNGQDRIVIPNKCEGSKIDFSFRSKGFLPEFTLSLAEGVEMTRRCFRCSRNHLTSIIFSLDQPSRPGEHLRWNRQADLLRRLEIYH